MWKTTRRTLAYVARNEFILFSIDIEFFFFFQSKNLQKVARIRRARDRKHSFFRLNSIATAQRQHRPRPYRAYNRRVSFSIYTVRILA